MSMDDDFASLRSLTAKTLGNIQSAHPELRRTEETLRSLTSLLDGIEIDLQSSSSKLKNNQNLEQRLGVLINLCLVSLTKLSKTLEQSTGAKVTDVSSLNGSEASASNVDERHLELSMRYTDIAKFVEDAGINNTRTVEEQKEAPESSHEQETMILEAVHEILTDENMPQETSTILTTHQNDHTAIWKHLRDRLKISGFKSSDVERHKTTIFHKLHDSLHLHRHGLNGLSGGPVGGRPHIDIPASTEPIDTRTPSMTFHEHLQRHASTKSNNYRPPAASTVYDDSDDDARSVGSEASTLLGPINERNPDDYYVLRPPSIQRPVSRNTQQMAEPRSQRSAQNMTYEKIVEFPSSPRESVSRPWPIINEPPRNRPQVRNGGPMPRPVSPRERDQRYGTMPRRPSSSRNLSVNSKYDYDVLFGKRSNINPVWRYRRNGDMYPPRNQSMDIQDDALPTAAADGRMNEVQKFLWEGRNIESFGSRDEHQTRNFYRTTALYRAAKQGHFAIVHLLLCHGANPNPRRNDGKSLLRLLADEGSTEMLRLLLEYGADIQRQGALPQAALFGHFNVVQLLLEYGADVNEIERQTALYRASSNGYPQIVELLLREGADTQFTTAGHSALYKAVQHEHYQCVRVLLQYGARPDVGIGRYAETILHVASDSGNEPIVRALLRRGALPNECNGYQTTTPIDGRRRFPLHFAAKGGHVGVARLLLDYGADANVLTDDGRGPVDVAIEQGHNEMRDLLSRAGGFPQQAMSDRGFSYRGQDIENPRGSLDSLQARKFSSSLPDRPHPERPPRERRPSGLSAPRSFEQEPRPRERSSTRSRRSDNAPQQQQGSTSSRIAAATGLLASSLLMFGGG